LQQSSLFDKAITRSFKTKPFEPPSLAYVKEINVDLETTGLRWWAGDEPLGVAVGIRGGPQFYLPTGHTGGNMPLERVQDYCRQEFKGKHIRFFNAPFDINMFYAAWGIDLEEMGCTVSDVGHYDALLDDRRQANNLDSVGKRWLGRGKVEGIDTRNMAQYHAEEVRSYAETDVELLDALTDRMWPELDRQGLQRVRQLEDDCVFPTCEMIRNGSPLDEELLEKWLKQARSEYVQGLWELHKLTGMKINPRSTLDLRNLFAKYDIPIPKKVVIERGEETIKETFDKEHLNLVNHPMIKPLQKVRRLASLISKYLIPYRNEVHRDHLLRYSLHQLRVDDEGGTVSGRYSSSKLLSDPDEGVNIQQVAGKKHLASIKDDEDLAGYVIRALFVPEPGNLWLSGDAARS